MHIDIKTLHSKKSNVAFAYSTKDRVDFTQQTLPRVLAEKGDFDVFWIDGSDKGSPASKLWGGSTFSSPKLTEVHLGVVGGAAYAIQYGLMTLFNKGYEYIGLIENDVLLTQSWFARIMGLFAPSVGAVSARTFTHRILQSHKDYADMANVGAGMILFKREMVPLILANWRMPVLWEVQALCKHFTDHDYPVPPEVLKRDPKIELHWQFTHDWYFEPTMWSKGFSTLAPIPSMAINLDDPQGTRDPVETGASVSRATA